MGHPAKVYEVVRGPGLVPYGWLMLRIIDHRGSKSNNECLAQTIPLELQVYE